MFLGVDVAFTRASVEITVFNVNVIYVMERFGLMFEVLVVLH